MKSRMKEIELAHKRLNEKQENNFKALYRSLDDENLFFLEFYQKGECITLEEAKKRYGENCTFYLVRFVKDLKA